MQKWSEEIRAEHSSLHRQMESLHSTLAAALSTADRQRVLSWTVQSFWPTLQTHLRREETTLFPALEKALGKNIGALVLLRRQHQEFRRAFRHLAQKLRQPVKPEDPGILLAILNVAETLENHEAMEEKLLLSVLKRRPSTMKSIKFALVAFFFSLFAWNICAAPLWAAEKLSREKAVLTYAPEVPPPILRRKPAIVEVHLDSGHQEMEMTAGISYPFWTFNGHVPGPFIRTRVGDILEMHVTNSDHTGMPHNVDLHAVTGPGGGAKVTTAVEGEEKVAWFKLLHPGLFIYHCAAPPVMDHIANGMYGLILVQPKKGLPTVDREFYVLQSDFYTKEPAEGATTLEFSHEEGAREHPRFVVFNGRVGALTGEGTLKAKTGEKVRIYFGNAGPNLISSFHVIGEIFDSVYREGDLVSPPARSVQTTLVPAGGATAVEFALEVPGTYTLVDHAIFRIEKGAVGFLEVEGKPRHDLYVAQDEGEPCEGCLVHP